MNALHAQGNELPDHLEEIMQMLKHLPDDLNVDVLLENIKQVCMYCLYECLYLHVFIYTCVFSNRFKYHQESMTH